MLKYGEQWMINILLVPINDLKTHPTDTRFIAMGKALEEKFNVRIFLLRYKKIPTDSKTDRTLKFELLDFNDLKADSIGLYYILNALPMSVGLSQILRERKIDVIIHANIVPSTIAVGLGRIFRVPIIFDYQDHFPESAAVYFKSNLLRSLAYSVTSNLNRINVANSDAVVTVTNDHKKLIQKLDANKLVEVIPNGVNSELFRPISKAAALQHLQMPQLNGKILLTYFGSIDSWLDFTTVFKALRRLLDRGLDISLLLIGYSHSKFYLEELKKNASDIGISDHVHFLGPVSQGRLVYYINASDVTLAPFKKLVMNQAVPLKILESLACGVPVCATGLREIAERFRGVVSLYFSEEELETALLNYIEHKIPLSPVEMEKIVQEYSWNGFAKSYYDLILRVINKYHAQK
jgi:glycosyltransferase involved in cell wall biosynthesis